MTAEKGILGGVFFLIMIGLGVLSAYFIYSYLQNNLILVVAGVALSWGIITLALYLAFRALDLSWWDR